MRRSGILMHISSLPGPGGIGSLGKEAYAFADFLKASGMAVWQVLPLGPTGYGESPYQSSSVFAGNPMLISCAALREAGLVTYDDGEEFTPDDPERVDYPAVRENKEKLLRRCFAQSEGKLQKELAAFRRENPWVEDFALFTALKARYGGAMWTKWPDREVRRRQPAALERCRRELDGEIRYHLFCQYLFFRQWFALKRYCNGLGIRLFGDMPIYVAEDSADTWTHPEAFQLDGEGVPKRVAGVPPDFFSADGQLWGNPLYRWFSLRLHGYGWWVERMAAMAKMYDIVRIDHFIGFANYYSVPQGAPNARTGKWIIGPGKSLFRTLEKKIPGLNIVAEDLGCVNDRVRRLLTAVGYPGMRVLSFGFGGGADNPHLPANYVTNSVVYTGTHDNDTVRGWIDTADDAALAQARQLLGFDKPEDGPAAFVRAVLASRADTAMIPMQDVLGLGGWARMNRPGTIGNNWLWRMAPGAATPELAQRLRRENEATNRRMD
ncbi:MAG TPA: 4-alpha-glucanotransferase [Candidatus Egerieenecus merdigallinarum]|nr:4-alpha-glucanotransferase [Candidatus Egerieenecus merdigallinarum]